MEIAQAISLSQPAIKVKSFGQCHGTVPGNTACATGDGGEGSHAGRCPLGHTNPVATGFGLSQPGSVLLLRLGNDAGSTHSSTRRRISRRLPLLWSIQGPPKEAQIAACAHPIHPKRCQCKEPQLEQKKQERSAWLAEASQRFLTQQGQPGMQPLAGTINH